MKISKGIDLNQCVVIIDFLKSLEKSHLVTKSKVFSMDEFLKFLRIPDDNQNLHLKCVLVVGVFGLLRISELTNLRFEDVKKHSSYYSFYISISKTDQAKKGFKFFVVDEFVVYIDNYIQTFSDQQRHGRFFKKLGTNSPIGKNTIGKFPSIVANLLNLDDPSKYTGHAYRRTGATILADRGVDKITLKRAGRWTSDKACEGYIEESNDSKLVISKIISNGETAPKISSNAQPNVVNNVTISGGNNIILNLAGFNK
jgi:integrase